MNLNEMINGLVLTKTCTVSADADSKRAGIHKTVHVRVTYDGVTLQDVFSKQLATTVIQWQTKARDSYNSLTDGGTVTIPFSAPTRVAVDNKVATKSWMQDPNVPQAEKDAYIAELIAAKG